MALPLSMREKPNMSLSQDHIDAWVSYFNLLQVIANEVGLDERRCYNELNIAGGIRDL